MTKNLAGAYGFAVDDWVRLERFLILGSVNGTYYIGERELTIQNADVIRRCLAEDWERAINTIVGIATSWRAAKHDQALFALAIAASPKFSPDPRARAYALSHLSNVVRTGTHMFTFVKFVNEFRGWGVTLRRAVSRWYTEKAPKDLAYQMAKYQQRDGWTHHDVMHLAHPAPTSQEHQQLFNWAKTGQLEDVPPSLQIIAGLEAAKTAETAGEIVGLIGDHNLTREMIPTKWFNEVETWAALLPGMPMRALLRNLGKMTQVGLLTPLSAPATLVTNTLNNEQAVRGSHLHPWDILNTLYWYRQGRGMLGNLRWTPVQTIVDARPISASWSRLM
jgi:60 kDa SS-A/Ro ribonucleoprotein